jgi:hypothetical protein
MHFKSWLELDEGRYPFDAHIKNHIGNHIPIYLDPTFEELESLNTADVVRAWLDNQHCYAWKAGSGLHFSVNQHLELKNGIPVYLYFDRQEVDVQITDQSRNTKWHENPQVARKIRSHPYIKKMWKKVMVSYYNDAIVGDWAKRK